MVQEVKELWKLTESNIAMRVVLLIILFLIIIFLLYVLWIGLSSTITAKQSKPQENNTASSAKIDSAVKKIDTAIQPEQRTTIIGKNVNTGTNNGIIGDISVNNDAQHLDGAISDLMADGTNPEKYDNAEDFLKNYFNKYKFRGFRLSNAQLTKLHEAFKYRPHFGQTLLPLLCYRENRWANDWIKRVFVDPAQTNSINFEAIGNYFAKIRDLKMFENSLASYINRDKFHNFWNLINLIFSSPDNNLKFLVNSPVILEVLDPKTCALIIEVMQRQGYAYFDIVKSSLLYKKGLTYGQET